MCVAGPVTDPWPDGLCRRSSCASGRPGSARTMVRVSGSAGQRLRARIGAGVEMLVAGRYRLVEQLGRGGMGAVWRAEDTLLGREVAVKVLTARLEADEQEQRRRYERVQREARSAALISHRNVVVVHDIVEDSQGLPCIVMELVRGRSLAQAIADGPLAPAEAARIGCEILAALRAAHRARVLH